MIPINFILNFQVSAEKATQGITKMSSSIEAMMITSQQLRNNFDAWWGSSLPEQFKNSTILIDQFRNSLINAFDTELEKQFGKGLLGISNDFIDLQRNVKLTEVQKSFDMLTDRLKFMATHIKIADQDFINMFDSITNIRMASGKDFDNLTKNLEKIGTTFEKLKPKQQQAMQKLFEEFAKSKKSANELLVLEKGLDKIIKKQEGIETLKNSFSDLFGFLPNGVDTLRQIARAAGAYTVFQDAAEAQEQMVTTMTQLGMVAGNSVAGIAGMTKSTMDFSYAVLDLGDATQVSMKQATEAMSSLANARVTTNIDDMKELSVTSLRMGQAFGMSTDQATEFIKSLYRIGGLAKGDVAKAADTLADVQYQLGLTASEASGVAAQVGSMTRTMKVFGGRVKDISAMTKGVAKLNVAFTKAGLSADEANQMLTKMMDPSNIEENILLYQGLGMTAQDAIGMMTGDTSKLANMDERMIQLAKNLKAQYGGNVFALQEMAKQYGMTLEQVQSLSQLTAKDMEMKKEGANLEEQANKARMSMMGGLQKLWNQLNVLMQNFVLPLINILTPALTLATQGIGKISTGLSWIRDKLGIIGKLFTGALGAGALAILLGLIHPIKLISKGFEFVKNSVIGVKDTIVGLKDTIKGAIDGAKNLVSKLKGLGKVKSPTEALAAPKLKDKLIKQKKEPAVDLQKTQPKSKGSAGEGFLKGLQKVDPAKILAVGAAIFFIAAGIALITASVALLAKALKDLNPEQINGLIGVMAVVMGGMVLVMLAFALAVSVLGAAGLAAAPGLLAIGAAMLLISIGVAVVVASIALLVSTISKSTEGMAAFSLIVSSLLPLFAGIALGITAVGAAMIMLGTFAPVAAAGLLVLAGTIAVLTLLIPLANKLGTGFANMGMGVKNIADNAATAVSGLLALRDTISSIGGKFASSFIEEINALASSLANLASSAMNAASNVMIPQLSAAINSMISSIASSLSSLSASAMMNAMGSMKGQFSSFLTSEVSSMAQTLAALSANILSNTLNTTSGKLASSFAQQASTAMEIASKQANPMLGSKIRTVEPITPVATALPAAENTGKVESLIAESNSYLSVIMDNTNQMVKILTNQEKPKKEVYSRTVSQKSIVAK